SMPNAAGQELDAAVALALVWLEAHGQAAKRCPNLRRIAQRGAFGAAWSRVMPQQESATEDQDRKSTRLNSSHVAISYAVFCLKKKKKIKSHKIINNNTNNNNMRLI